MFRGWSRLTTRLLGVRVEVHGSPPAPPVLLVSNHLSYIDILVIASRLPAQFIAKSEVRGWPFVGLMCRAVGTLFVDRSSRRDVLRVGHEISARIERGNSVVLFPEGTSTDGRDVTTFKPSLLAGPAATAQPVHYATLSYRTPGDDPPAHIAVCWWGDMTFGDHFLRLLAVRSCTASLTFGDQALQDGDRKALARRLEASVRQQFEPVPTKPNVGTGSEPESVGSGTVTA